MWWWLGLVAFSILSHVAAIALLVAIGRRVAVGRPG
jgi:hypothetical protein